MTESKSNPAPLVWEWPYHSRRMPVFAPNVVATSQPLAAQAGLRMLADGGNAVDAALAAAITLTVVEPTSNGIGGDLFALIWDGNRLHGLNGSGKSPASWRLDRFAGMQSMPETGWDTITVPGAVDAWVRLSQRFGALPFEALFKPAINYARNGFTVGPVTSERWQAAADELKPFAEFGRTFLLDGKAPLTGEIFRCPDQADTLAKIAASGGEDFYRGDLAAKMADAARAEGGALSLEDLASHRAQWVNPLSVPYRRVRLFEMPPNGQGLAALIALGILERFDMKRYPLDSTDSVHLQIEAMKCAFEVAFDHIADPDWMSSRPDDFLTGDALNAYAEGIRLDRAAETGAPGSGDGGTVYLAAADDRGWMVSLIQSNYLGFGSGIVIPGTGISMQNRARGFVLTDSHPNRVDGGKRPSHTIIPGFVTLDDSPLMSFGVMGGHMQPQGHVQMMVRIFDYHQNPQSACDAPRWLVGQDGSVALEPAFGSRLKRELVERGHRLIVDQPFHQFGGAQIIYRLSEGYCAASDPRKEGLAIGF
jgi:gamma-glutamyltranspeptidase/glutathione hydrolase